MAITPFLQQTICRELSIFKKQNTIQISRFLFFLSPSACITIYIVCATRAALVTKFVFSYDPQITKARCSESIKSDITLNSGLSMSVGISEAILFVIFQIFPFLFKICFNGLENVTLSNVHLRSANQNLLKHSSPKIIDGNRIIIKRSFVSNSSATEHTAPNPSTVKKDINSDPIFNQWLAGIIDGAGCFKVSKKGYANLDIIMKITDKHCLYQIKQKFGGAVKLRSGINYLRYRVHHKKGLLDLINAVNGEIRNPVRLLQLNKICETYKVSLTQPSVLCANSAWFSGFFDSVGSVDLIQNSTDSTTSLLITVSHTNRYLLNPLINLYGGAIEVSNNNFTWKVNKIHEIKQLLDYFKLCPARSTKHKRLKEITRYLELRKLKANLASDQSILGKAWRKFLLKWDKYEK